MITFRNTSSRACWLGGHPDLSGVTTAGAVKPLVFSLKSDDPAQVIAAPAGPAGVLRPGALGAVNLTLTDHDCPPPVPGYRTLRISVGPGAALTMPFPPELEMTRCLFSEAEMGPVPADATSTPASSDIAGREPCRMNELAVVLGTGGVASGTAYQQLDFRNLSKVACLLKGYPSLTFLDRSGDVVGGPAEQENPTGAPLVAVLLAPGESGHASMGVASAENFPVSSCRPMATVRIRVAVPGDVTGRVIASRNEVCATGPSSTLITPFAVGVPDTAVG